MIDQWTFSEFLWIFLQLKTFILASEVKIDLWGQGSILVTAYIQEISYPCNFCKDDSTWSYKALKQICAEL